MSTFDCFFAQFNFATTTPVVFPVFNGRRAAIVRLDDGSPQGAVWIGKPLDLTIPLAVESSELGESLCLGADVTQGDSQIADRNVSVRFEPNGGNARMRIRTTVVIEEPTVSINVRAGCEARSIRNYVLLADVPTEVSQPVVPAPAARASSLPPVSRAEGIFNWRFACWVGNCIRWGRGNCDDA